MSKLNLLTIAALAALVSCFAPAQAQAASQCEAGFSDIGVYRNRSVCYSAALFPAPIPESECADGGKYGAYMRDFIVIGNDLYCVISQAQWESRGHLAAKISERTDWVYSPGHCSKDPAVWKIVGTHQQAVVCVRRGSGQADIGEQACGKGGYASGIVVKIGDDKYCLLHTAGAASRFGWSASLIVPECEIRHRGRQAKSLGPDAMTPAECIAKAATVL